MTRYAARGAQLSFSVSNSTFAQGGIRVAGLADGGFSVVWASADNDRTAFDGDLYGQTFRSDLSATSSDPAMLISDTGPSFSYPLNQAIVGLNNAGFALISTDDARFSVADASNNREAAVRLYDSSGAAIHDPIFLGAALGFGEAITTLSDGRLVAGWIDTQGALRAQYLTASGDLLGSSFIVASPSGDFASRPVFSAAENGGWIATYVSQNSAVGHAVFFNGSGQASADIGIATDVTNLQGVQVKELANGNSVMLWGALNQNRELETHAQLYAGNGVKLGEEILVSTTSSSVTSVAALNDGGFVIALEPQRSAPVELKVYNAVGHQTGATIDIDNAVGPDVASLAGGGFVVAWKDAGGGFHAQAYAGAVPSVQGDIDGDHRADILWRDDSGTVTDWLGRPDGGFSGNDAAALIANIPNSWHISGVADINGDGRSDVLWRNDSGLLTDWLGTTQGGFVGNDATALANVSTDWKIAGLADFNGDGRADILWRNDNGTLTDWLGRADGGFTSNDTAALFANVATSWKVAGVGDFNGDGRADILWRNDNGTLTDWLGNPDGGFTSNDGAALFANVPTSWHVAGVGDFNGDTYADILWRNDNGALTDWLGKADGGFTSNDSAASVAGVSTTWHVAQVADYNGDGRADILWRNDNGALTDWLGRTDGGFSSNDAAASVNVASVWHPQPQNFNFA